MCGAFAARPADAIARKVHRESTCFDAGKVVDPEEEERPGKKREYDLSVILDSHEAMRVLAQQRDKLQGTLSMNKCSRK